MTGCRSGWTGKFERRGGGCAFCGARMALQPITDAVHLVHGPMLCLGHNWVSRPTQSSGSLLHRADFTTALSEMDVVFGGEAKLVAAIGQAVARHDPAAVFVYQTCVPAMTGDDVAAACATAAAKVARPVIPVDLPGLSGTKDYGTWAAADVLLDHVIGTREPGRITDTDILLIGEYNVAGEVDRIRALLAKLDIRILASIPGDGRFAEIATAHRAKAAVTLCSRALDGLAEKLEARYGIPFLRGSFHGIANVSNTLRGIAGLLAAQGGPADLPDRAEALIRHEEARVETRLRPYRALLAGKRAALASGGVKAWSLAAALQSLGMEVVATSVAKTSEEERGCAARVVGEDRLTQGLPQSCLQGGSVDVALGGGIARREAMRAGVAWVEINHERPMALCGYDGTVRLAAAIHAALSQTLLASVTASPPWERHTAIVTPFPGRCRP
jgi:Nitrogenase molybdenum-iron protein, alpha and beta chains